MIDVDIIESARKELARRSLADFACMIDIPTVPISRAEDEDSFSSIRLNTLALHHQVLLEKCQGIVDGTIPNLMIMMPPGSAKSTYVDLVLIPWFMAKRPRAPVILASYASDIAEKQGRRCRQVVQSQSFKNLTGLTLRTDNKAADRWQLSNGSEFMCGGILSGINGNRAHLGIIDDPIRGREQAESQTQMDKLWTEYKDVFCSRLVPGAPQIIISTRWSEMDIMGRILPDDWDGESGMIECRDGRSWYVLCVPAECNRADDPLGRQIGELLWTEWFPPEFWDPFRLDSRSWNSLFQQNPSPEEGNYFKRETFRYYSTLPSNLLYYGASDYAVTDAGGDFTEHGVFGVDEHSNIYVVDWVSMQKTADIWIESQIKLMLRYDIEMWFGESGVIQKSVQPLLGKMMKEARCYKTIEWLPSNASTGGKKPRARSIQGRFSMGMVYFPEGKTFMSRIESQLLKFDSGRHDDIVDVFSLIGRGLDIMQEARPIIPKHKPPETGTIKWIYERTKEEKPRSKYKM